MDGILPPFQWITARASLRVPYLANQPCGRSFEYFPQANEFRWTGNAAGPFHGCETISSLSVSLQCSLFFQLLSTFLEGDIHRDDIHRDDFVHGGFIDLTKAPVHGYFQTWKTGLSHLSYVQKRWAQRKIQALINFAALNSDRSEQAAENFNDDETFDDVALSVKLLISLLDAISKDTFSIVLPRSSEPWAPWAATR